MADFLRRVFRTFSKLFITETEPKEPPERFRPRTPPKYFTPLRSTSFASHRVPHTSRRSSTPASSRRSCPIIQCPSQISLKKFNSDSDLSLKNEKSGNISIDRHFVENNKGTIPMRNNEFEISQPPSYKSSNSSFDYFSMAGDAFDPSESCHEMFTIRRQFGKNKQILHPGSASRVNHRVLQPSSRSSTHASTRRSCPIIQCPSQMTQKKFNPDSDLSLKNEKSGNIWCLHACDNPKSCNDIPVRDLNRRNQRGLHTLTTQQKRTIGDVDRSQQDGGDNRDCITSLGIGNFVEFRNETIARFERVFKSLSRKKFTIGNLMDPCSHARWMLLSGIGVDHDAQLFKMFAGGKVVLNIGEYKFLIAKICKTYELDFWNVLRKMAMTYEYEDPQH